MFFLSLASFYAFLDPPDESELDLDRIGWLKTSDNLSLLVRPF